MNKISKIKEGKGVLLVIVIVVIVLLVLVYMARQRAGDETSLDSIPASNTSPSSSLNTNVQVPPPAESDLEKKIGELETMIDDFGSDLKDGKSLDFSDLEPDDKTSAKFEDL